LIPQYHLQKPSLPEGVTEQQYAKELVMSGVQYDPSTYANWEDLAGTGVHLELVPEAADIIFYLIFQNLKTNRTDVPEPFQRAYDELLGGNREQAKLKTIIAGAFHDVGRLVRQTFLVNERDGNVLLREMNVRPDIVKIITGEEVMQGSGREDTIRIIQQMDPLAVLVRMADEFGKCKNNQGELYTLEDYRRWDGSKWAQGYTQRPYTGDPRDLRFRSMVQRHVLNVQDYFDTLDLFVSALTNINLATLSTQLSSTLQPKVQEIASKISDIEI
jgi:hypothetical protein